MKRYAIALAIFTGCAAQPKPTMQQLHPERIYGDFGHSNAPTRDMIYTDEEGGTYKLPAPPPRQEEDVFVPPAPGASDGASVDQPTDGPQMPGNASEGDEAPPAPTASEDAPPAPSGPVEEAPPAP